MTVKVVVLAFDGLSSKDVLDEERFMLSEFRQEENRYIDLGERPFYLTSELFTDLITGKRYKEHGVRDLVKYSGSQKVTCFESWLKANYYPVWQHSRKYREGLYKMRDITKTKWEREDIDSSTIFDHENSFQEQTPVWDWRLADPLQINAGKEYRFLDRSERAIKKEWNYSKRVFWGEAEEEDRYGIKKAIESDHENWLYFQHFHYIDWMQHLYREAPEGFDWEDWFSHHMNEHWWNANEFVSEVKDFLDNTLDDYLLILMSDHGIPEQQIGHRPNAFVSANKPILPENPSLELLHKVIKKETGIK